MNGDETNRIILDLFHRGFLDIYPQDDGSFLFTINAKGQIYLKEQAGTHYEKEEWQKGQEEE